MSTINLSDLSVDNSGNTPLIIKDGKIQCANEEIQSICINVDGGIASYTSSQIISMVNAGYLPYIILEEGIGLFKYYYYDIYGGPWVLFDLVNGRESEEEETVSKSQPSSVSVPIDFIDYLNCAAIDYEGYVDYPISNSGFAQR